MPQQVLPEVVDGSNVVLLRRWLPADAEALDRLVLDSLEHLRPWMAWCANEPLSLARRRAMLSEWEHEWRRGGDVYMGIFRQGRAVGSCGLHRRIGPHGLEIGYWIHPAFLRQGLATEAARLLTGAAFSVPGVDHVEIHHDKANRASAGIPQKLAFKLVGEKHDEVPDPAGTGISYRWRADRARWTNSDPQTAE